MPAAAFPQESLLFSSRMQNSYLEFLQVSKLRHISFRSTHRLISNVLIPSHHSPSSDCGGITSTICAPLPSLFWAILKQTSLLKRDARSHGPAHMPALSLYFHIRTFRTHFCPYFLSVHIWYLFCCMTALLP